MDVDKDRFIFDVPKENGLDLDMLQQAISFWALELNDQNQFLNDHQFEQLKSNYNANAQQIENICAKALDVLEYSGIMQELIKPGQILNDVRCTLNEDFGNIVLEWL